MAQLKTKSPIGITLPEKAKTLHAFGNVIKIFLGAEETADSQTLFIDTTPPGGGPPPHYHQSDDELFYVLSGEVEFLVDGEWQAVAEGGSVFVPHGVVHTFRNVGDGPLTLLVTTNSSSMESFFEQCAEVFAQAGPPDMGKIMEISAAHGVHFVES